MKKVVIAYTTLIPLHMLYELLQGFGKILILFMILLGGK
jgi:hypothetical protein